MMRYFSLGSNALTRGVPLAEVLPAIHEEDRPTVAAALADAVDKLVPYQVEYRVHHSDGRERWLSARGLAERDDTGRAVGLPGFGGGHHRTKTRRGGAADTEAQTVHPGAERWRGNGAPGRWLTVPPAWKR